RAASDHPKQCWPRELLLNVRERGLPPSEERSYPGEEQQDEANRRHPFVEERRGNREARARNGFAQRREHRAEQDEERGEQQNPVVNHEGRFAREPRIELVARLQYR